MSETSRRVALRVLTATAVPISAAVASSVPGGAELIRLLTYADRLSAEERASSERRPNPELDLDGWKASLRISWDILARRDELHLQAAALPAVTAAGRRAKVLSVRDWIGDYPGATRPSVGANADEHLAWSMLQDILRAGIA